MSGRLYSKRVKDIEKKKAKSRGKRVRPKHKEGLFVKNEATVTKK